MLRRLRYALRMWWRCRRRTCDYYRYYLAEGPPELVHEGYHAAERKLWAIYDYIDETADCLSVPRESWDYQQALRLERLVRA